MSDLLFDTSAVSAAMAGSAEFDAYLARLEPKTRLFTSVIVEGEIRFGLARLGVSRRRSVLDEAFEAVLGSLHDVLETTRDVATEYGLLKASLWASGTPIGENDIWIASTSRVHDLALVSSDPDFSRVPDLRVETWSSN